MGSLIPNSRYFTVQKALTFLNESASIIFNGLVNALTGIADSSLYTANKGAVHALARAAELICLGIRVNTITIGLFQQLGVLPATLLGAQIPAPPGQEKA